MEKYYINVVEYLTKTIEIEATTEDEAKVKFNTAYRNGSIKLNSDDSYYAEPFQVIDQDEIYKLELPFVRLKDLKILN